jgi:hypothetical protein
MVRPDPRTGGETVKCPKCGNNTYFRSMNAMGYDEDSFQCRCGQSESLNTLIGRMESLIDSQAKRIEEIERQLKGALAELYKTEWSGQFQIMEQWFKCCPSCRQVKYDYLPSGGMTIAKHKDKCKLSKLIKDIEEGVK